MSEFRISLVVLLASALIWFGGLALVGYYIKG